MGSRVEIFMTSNRVIQLAMIFIPVTFALIYGNIEERAVIGFFFVIGGIVWLITDEAMKH